MVTLLIFFEGVGPGKSLNFLQFADSFVAYSSPLILYFLQVQQMAVNPDCREPISCQIFLFNLMYGPLNGPYIFITPSLSMKYCAVF